MKLTTEDTESAELKPDQHEPVTLKLELTYTFEPSECLPDDWEGTRDELVEWFSSDMAENFRSWINPREIYDSIQEEDEKATMLADAAPELLVALKQCFPLAQAHVNYALGEGGYTLEVARAAIAKAEGREK